jgi:proteasome lid subunit RPN8/RPN11
MKIAAAQLTAMRIHALRGYPFEVCGILLGPADVWPATTVSRVVEMANHETEAPRVRYLIPPADQLRVQNEARAEGLDIVGFYHSHPDHPARPSETDRRIAAAGLSDGVLHVVVGVQAGVEATPAGFVFRDADAAFAEVVLEIVP